MNTNTLSDNPLLNQGDLPDFAAIRPEHVIPAVREAIKLGNETLKTLQSLQDPTWETFV